MNPLDRRLLDLLHSCPYFDEVGPSKAIELAHYITLYQTNAQKPRSLFRKKQL